MSAKRKEKENMQIGNIHVNSPLFLGPMAGVTDWAFRTVCAEIGAGVTVTEMVSSRALVYQDKKSKALLKKNDGSICGAQIFGNDPEIMAQGAILALEHSGCDFIDINMGCPMPKIANSGDGCGLMKTPELAGDIVKAVVGDKPSLNVSISHDGELGMEAELSVYLGTEYAKAIANLYYFNEESRELEFVSANEIRADGTAKFVFTHASEYVIVIEEAEEEIATEVIVENDTEIVDNTEQPKEESSSVTEGGSTLWWIAILLVFAAGIIFFVKRKTKQEER